MDMKTFPNLLYRWIGKEIHKTRRKMCATRIFFFFYGNAESNTIRYSQ